MGGSAAWWPGRGSWGEEEETDTVEVGEKVTKGKNEGLILEMQRVRHTGSLYMSCKVVVFASSA